MELSPDMILTLVEDVPALVVFWLVFLRPQLVKLRTQVGHLESQLDTLLRPSDPPIPEHQNGSSGGREDTERLRKETAQ